VSLHARSAQSSIVTSSYTIWRKTTHQGKVVSQPKNHMNGAQKASTQTYKSDNIAHQQSISTRGCSFKSDPAKLNKDCTDISETRAIDPLPLHIPGALKFLQPVVW
jgi:hypothetical protein